MNNYYLQLEDDVTCTPNFISAIQLFINQNKDNHWTNLQFSDKGFIGKLFHSKDLEQFAKYLMLFYQEMPVDYLLQKYSKLIPDEMVLEKRPHLFKHIGYISSLGEKSRQLHERIFKRAIIKKLKSF